MSLFLCRDYHLKKVTHVLVIFSSTVSQFVTNDTIYLMHRVKLQATLLLMSQL